MRKILLAVVAAAAATTMVTPAHAACINIGSTCVSVPASGAPKPCPPPSHGVVISDGSKTYYVCVS